VSQVQGEVLLAPHLKKGIDYDRAYEQTTWPKLSTAEDGTPFIELGVRSWDLNGNFLMIDETMKLSKVLFGDNDDEKIEIRTLPVFPLRLAEESMHSALKRRGEKFWTVRESRYVAYTGLDVDSEEFIVSTPCD
jgi:hypothetical protein